MKLKRVDRMIKGPYSRSWLFLCFTSLIMVSTSHVPSDAMKLAFQSSHNLEDFTFSIYVVNVNGNNLVRLTQKSTSSGSPSWSPDGRKIAFTSDRDGNFDIYVMTADGKNLTQLTNDLLVTNVEPSWSPDGRQIAFASDREGYYDLYIMTSNGDSLKNLTQNPAGHDIFASWQPEPFAVSSEGKLVTVWGIVKNIR